MTSRERVLAAIQHHQPDKVPVDLGSTPSSGISAIAYSNLIKHIRKHGLPVQVYDVVQQLAQPDMSVIDLFGVDVIDIGRGFNDKPSDWKPTTLSNGASAFYPQWFNPVKLDDGTFATYDDDGKTMLSLMPVGATFFDQTYFPYLDGYPDTYENLDTEMGRIMWARDAHSPWDHAHKDDFWAQLREKALHFRQTTDKALLIVCGCNLFEWGTFLRRIDNFLMDLMCDPYNVEKLLDQLVVRHLATLEKVCSAVGDIADIIRFGDDLGMTWNMDPGFLKREFGQQCTFWGGGIETAGMLNTGSPLQIREQVLERMEIFSQGGGFVFNTVHNILPDVPPENILAMFDAIHEFNNY